MYIIHASFLIFIFWLLWVFPAVSGLSLVVEWWLLWLQIRASLVTQTVKNLPAMQETWVPSPGQEDPLEKGMAAHSSILAQSLLQTKESLGPQRTGHDRATNAFTGSRAHGSLVELYKLSCPVAYGILVPRPGIELTSLALEGGFLSTGPPGMSVGIRSWTLSQVLPIGFDPLWLNPRNPLMELQNHRAHLNLPIPLPHVVYNLTFIFCHRIGSSASFPCYSCMLALLFLTEIQIEGIRNCIRQFLCNSHIPLFILNVH